MSAFRFRYTAHHHVMEASTHSFASTIVTLPDLLLPPLPSGSVFELLQLIGNLELFPSYAKLSEMMQEEVQFFEQLEQEKLAAERERKKREIIEKAKEKASSEASQGCILACLSFSLFSACDLMHVSRLYCICL